MSTIGRRDAARLHAGVHVRADPALPAALHQPHRAAAAEPAHARRGQPRQGDQRRRAVSERPQRGISMLHSVRLYFHSLSSRADNAPQGSL